MCSCTCIHVCLCTCVNPVAQSSSCRPPGRNGAAWIRACLTWAAAGALADTNCATKNSLPLPESSCTCPKGGYGCSHAFQSWVKSRPLCNDDLKLWHGVTLLIIVDLWFGGILDSGANLEPVEEGVFVVLGRTLCSLSWVCWTSADGYSALGSTSQHWLSQAFLQLGKAGLSGCHKGLYYIVGESIVLHLCSGDHIL